MIVETITPEDIAKFDIPDYALRYKGEQFESSIPEGAVYVGANHTPGSVVPNKYGGPDNLVILFNFKRGGDSVGTKFHNLN